jgi:hypothetical protein
MTRLRRNIDKFLHAARLAVVNAAGVPPIGAALAQFGFDVGRLQEGAALLATAESLQAAQRRRYSEQYVASAALRNAWAAADKTYSAHRTLARLAFHSEPDRRVALLLHTPKKRILDPWLGQAGVFYQNLLGDSEMLAAMARYNITADLLAEAQTAVTQVALLNAAQKKEKANAQQGTRQRDAALDALNAWYVEFRTVARLALADDPQLLEALGFGPVA